ncbi:MAG: aldehyde dehydrogenase family protein [Bacteroidia bacterium]|jgi:succinate-semialdehyde dehydrogenase/glutarate-semialdehyde dehydrogenase|nr:aldehyde dehydrogenase family protein [Bacteroidia bacterium]
MNFISQNPYTEEVIATFDFIDNSALNQAMDDASKAQSVWKKTLVKDRVIYIKYLAELLTEHHERLALIACEEMGKTLKEAKLEVLKCARGCEYYAKHATDLLQPKTSIAETGKTVTLQYEPLGVVLGIFPWNFPYWQIIRSAVPIVLAGNAILIKPAPGTPRCAIELMKIIEASELPAKLMQMIFANTEQVEAILADSRVQAATLTGSEKAGSAVASVAAKHIKKSVLELGGSDPFIVFNDADLTTTLNTAITARFQNNGQSCIAAKRFIVDEKIADKFLNGLTDRLNHLTLGNPLSPETNIGPLARKDLCDQLNNQVKIAIKHGAKILYQAPVEQQHGYFFPPTILGEISPVNPVFQEELFGPVVSFYTFTTMDEAIALANATGFGLGASIWTANIELARSIAVDIEAGQVFINEMVKSQPSYPFGGIKKSGFGRELGEFGLYEFCNLKSVWH